MNGVIEDPRPREEREKDYKHNLLYGALPVSWVEKPQDKWKKYSLRNQDGSGSCVPQSKAKTEEVLFGPVMSAVPCYKQRSNYPSPGMYYQDLGKISLNDCNVTESECPSQNMNDGQIDGTPMPTKLRYKAQSYIFPNTRNIDELASIVQNGKPFPISFKMTYEEWQNVPKVNPLSKDWLYHSVAVVDTTLWMGQKALIIDDSWGHATSIGNGGQRVITEEYLLARCTGAIYFNYSAPLILREGSKGNDVINLQTNLTLLNYPLKADGDFGPRTRQTVKDFQLQHGLIPDGAVGPKTQKAILNAFLSVETTGNKIDAWCEAIKKMEGSNSSWNNPGNLEYRGQLYTLGGIGPNNRFAHFDTYEHGYAALKALLVRACTGQSSVYNPDMTLVEFYQKYAPSTDNNNPNHYAQFVADQIGCDITTKIKYLL